MAQGGASILLPLFITFALKGNPADFGLVTGIASLFGVAASLFWGRWSDRLKRRKPFVIVGFMGTAIGLIFMGLSQSIVALMIANALLTFLWLASVSVSTPLVLEGHPKDTWESRIGRFNRLCSIGWSAGLVLGMLWTATVADGNENSFALRFLFLILASIAVIGTIFAVLSIREPRPSLSERKYEGLAVAAGALWERFRFAPTRLFHLANPNKVWQTLRGRNIYGAPLTSYYYSIIIYSIAFQMYFVPLPLYLSQVLEVSAPLIFGLYILHQGTSAFANPYVAVYAKTHRTRYLQRFFIGLRIGIFLFVSLIFVFRDIPALLLGSLIVTFLLSGLSWAFIDVSAIAIISRRVRIGQRSQAIGAYHSSIGTGNILGSLIGGFIATWSFSAAFIAASALLMAALIMGMRLPRRREVLD